MTSFQPWDIVVVPFPFTEGDTEKRRPALVVSTSRLAADHGLYWLLMITSAENRRWKNDVSVSHHQKAGLPVPSVIRTAKIATLQEDRILRRLGSLDAADRAAVQKAIGVFLT